MKILTWNINGIRASKVPLKQLFDSLDADIICLQETKVTRDMLDERSAIVDGYSSYYSFSNVKTGYSGVATYVREAATPIKAEQGLTGNLTTDDESAIGHYGDHSDFTEEELELLDKEGRTVITQHKILDSAGQESSLTVINVYCPRADPEREDRKTFKLRFYQLLQIRAEAILKSGSHVIILGDVNSSHRRIDHCDPDDTVEFGKAPGRMWLDQLLWFPEPTTSSTENNEPGTDKPTEPHSNKKDQRPRRRTPDTLPDSNPSGLVARTVSCSGGLFVDTFRYFHPTQTHAFTCWNTMVGARETNYGTRIDYIFADKDLAMTEFTDCQILPDVMGSDHCPVKGYLKCSVTAAKKCPALCTKYFPEFTGVQTKLSAFFTKGVKRQVSEESKSVSSSQPAVSEELKNGDKTKEANTVPSLTKSPSIPPPFKKAKTDKSIAMKKQSSLANFFNTKGDTEQPSKTADKTVTKQNPTEKQTKTLTDKSQTTDTKFNESDWKLAGKRQPQSSSAWKNLLKGPPPAPLCKGHKEACLLRTVKKEDSLNKGRQFYVCCRPEGHKSNPEARCDHFEWVEKKKKAK